MPIESLSSEICIGCKICVDVCPEDVLRFNEEERKAYIAYPKIVLPVGCANGFVR